MWQWLSSLYDVRLRLKDRYSEWAIVTGGHSGIGYALSEQLAGEGVNLIICARSQDKLNDAAAKIKEKHPGVQVRVVAADLSEEAGVDALIAAAGDVVIGIVIPDAGFFLPGWFVDTDPKDLKRMIFLNVMATTLLTRHFGRLMAERGKGGILLVSSILGVAPGPFFACYAATKAYVATLGESLCAEMAPLGVDVSVLVPALTKTNMSKAFVSAGAPADSPEHTAAVGLRALGRKTVAIPLLIYRLNVLLQTHVLPRFIVAPVYRLVTASILKLEFPPSFSAATKPKA